MNRVFEYRRTTSKTELKKKVHVVAYGKMKSSMHGKTIYLIARYNDGKILCSCPDAIFRKQGICKHAVGFLHYERMRKNK